MKNVLRDKVVEMCEALGFKGAGKWNKDRLSNKLASIATVAEESEWSIDDEELNDLLKVIVAEEGKVNVVQDPSLLDEEESEPRVEPDEEEEPEVEPESKPVPKEKKAPKVKKEPKAKKAKEPKVPKAKDQFGLWVGSKASELCSHLSEEGKTMKELVDSTPGSATSYNLLNRLCEAGLVVKEGNKYKVAW